MSHSHGGWFLGHHSTNNPIRSEIALLKEENEREERERERGKRKRKEKEQLRFERNAIAFSFFPKTPCHHIGGLQFLFDNCKTTNLK